MPGSSSVISDNINNINEKVKAAAAKSGRGLSDITILAASKTRSPKEILEAFNNGIKVFGENYVQEFLPKIESLVDYKDISWHIIGHLQKNKVKYITGKVGLIHSVDSVLLAKTIEKHSISQNIVTNILIEVNLAGEKTKNGATIDEAYNLVKEINKFQGLSLKGLMVMPPLEKNNRKYFKSLRELIKDINDKNIYKAKLSTLSMGTSGDFEVAIEEGATIIRLGTIIFGNRPPKNQTRITN
ncbi:MAG: YggS family pyridoxal phosphate-dependent enzyme [Deltaproteobacteria bacterium]|nr:YggS family pyridoxal phosphate-dependent enzyme [Deltaproteobacteria bacterium]